jgi:hypothetical protein
MKYNLQVKNNVHTHGATVNLQYPRHLMYTKSALMASYLYKIITIIIIIIIIIIMNSNILLHWKFMQQERQGRSTSIFQSKSLLYNKPISKFSR